MTYYVIDWTKNDPTDAGDNHWSNSPTPRPIYPPKTRCHHRQSKLQGMSDDPINSHQLQKTNREDNKTGTDVAYPMWPTTSQTGPTDYLKNTSNATFQSHQHRNPLSLLFILPLLFLISNNRGYKTIPMRPTNTNKPTAWTTEPPHITRT